MGNNLGRILLQKMWYFCLTNLDKCRGIDFFAPVDNGEQGVPDIEAGNRYQASSPLYDRSIKSFLIKSNHTNDKMLDVGCGKGRMLRFFSCYGFAKVDGVEYSPELAEIARRNMKKLGLPCEVFTGDAAEFTGYDGYNYSFLFNPLLPATMERFVGKLKESIARVPREITVMYTNPMCLSVFLENGFTSHEEGYGRHEFAVITNFAEKE